MKELNLQLYLNLKTEPWYSEEEFLWKVEQALQGCVTFLQLREKETSTREYLALAEKVHCLTKRYGVTASDR